MLLFNKKSRITSGQVLEHALLYSNEKQKRLKTQIKQKNEFLYFSSLGKEFPTPEF